MEFIFVLPLMLLLALAVWEYGLVLTAQLVATDAAREGARYAAVVWPANAQTIQDEVVIYLQDDYGNRIGTAAGDVSVTASQIQVNFYDLNGNATSSPSPGDEVQVVVPVQVTIPEPYVPGLASPFTVTGRMSMRLQ